MTSVDTIPVRLPPLPGEALDSWLETYAHLLHAGTGDIFQLAGLGPRWDYAARANGHKPWAYRLDPPDLASLSAVSGVPPATGHRAGRRQHSGGLAADAALVAAAHRLAVLPPVPGRERRPVDAVLADTVDLRLHLPPGTARRHLPCLRPAARREPHQAGPPSRPM